MNNHEIKAVIVDFGGVLVRSEDASMRRAWEKRLNLKPFELDMLVFDNPVAAQATIGTGTDRHVWQYVASVLGVSAPELAQLERDFWVGDRVDEELKEILMALKSRGFKTAILSNAWSNAREMFAREYGIIEGVTVEKIFISAELHLAKPDPAIYTQVMKAMNVLPENVLFVDDFLPNIEAANALNINTLHFQNPEHIKQQLKTL